MRKKIEILKKIHISLSNGIRAGKAKEPRKWLDKKGLSIDLSYACFNSGQMHHRREDCFIKDLAGVGFLKEQGVNGKKKGNPPSYSSFGKEAIIFPLKNENNEVVNFYAIRIRVEKQQPEYLNEEGIYPCYPHAFTKRLFITKCILDAATLLETKVLDNRDAVIALNEGIIKEHHLIAIENLMELEEIIYIS